MRLTIKNIEKIDEFKLPKLDGYVISWGKTEEHEYEFDVFLNHTLKMVLKVNRDSNYDGRGDMDNYTCIIFGGGISNNQRWQVVLHRAEFKTSIQFLNAAEEMVSKLSKDMEMQYNTTTMPPLQQWGNLPSVSAGTHITQSYNPF
jgi:hypothetical protein